ncbi:MAG: 50S ribosomal protein L13 [Dehalococcoidia bacterium]|nr:50S ribosomal protein L13 [Dehalococcoidia bacterium]
MMTYSVKASEVKRRWHVVDASGKTLGRVATEVARLLEGKHKTIYSPHADVGDFVVVINAAKVRVTGKKREDKIYRHHTQYPGGLRSIAYGDMMARYPCRPIEIAVRGMLPHNSRGRAMARRLKVYAGSTHPHEAQVKGSTEASSG